MKKLTGILALFATWLLLAGGIADAFHGKPTPIGWFHGSSNLVLMQGQTYEWAAAFCAESREEEYYTNVSWLATDTLAPFFGSEPKFIGDLEGGEPGEYLYSIRYTIRVPDDLKPGVYPGHIALIGKKNEKSRSTRAVLPDPLHMWITVIPAQ